MLEPVIDFIDDRILDAPEDGKPGGFSVLWNEVDFSHNTVQQHLKRLTAKDIVVREKVAPNGLGRPKFAYHVPSRATKQINVALADR